MIRNQRIPIIIVLTITVLFSIIRFAMLEGILKTIGPKANRNNAVIIIIMLYIFSLVIVGGMVVIAIRIGIYAIFAALIGSLAVEVIIMINSITEALGITRNQFGQKVK